MFDCLSARRGHLLYTFCNANSCRWLLSMNFLLRTHLNLSPRPPLDIELTRRISDRHGNDELCEMITIVDFLLDKFPLVGNLTRLNFGLINSSPYAFVIILITSIYCYGDIVIISVLLSSLRLRCIKFKICARFVGNLRRDLYRVPAQAIDVVCARFDLTSSRPLR